MPVENDYDPNEDYGRKYRRGADFEDGAETLTITDVSLENFADGTRKLALTLADDSAVTVNRRNFSRLTEKFGKDPNAWIGKTVTLMSGDKFNGSTSLLILPQKAKAAPARATDEAAGDVVFE